MANAYQWIQYAAARAVLAQRLADPTNQFWTDTENGAYLTEALRTWNALTEVWNIDFTFSVNAAPSSWINLATLNGSPRKRTVTDANICTMMQYHLLEQPSGLGPWMGTSQFSLAVLEGALQRRRDEVIQVSGCNVSQLSAIPVTPGTRRVALADTVLEPRRVRFLPAPNQGSPVTLTREDNSVWDHFYPDHAQVNTPPSSWGVIEGPPLSMDLDTQPNVPGTLDTLALVAGPTFNPPSASLLGVPDDWSWVPKWGALADLLSQESETTDLPRAQFCRERYMDGLKAMSMSNWLTQAQINGNPADTPSLAEMDNFLPEWEGNSSADPGIVVAGMDFIAPCPVPSVLTGLQLTLVGNAPIPAVNTDLVQVSRDTFDAILSYAQFLAMFKQGGAEFLGGLQLVSEFAAAVAAQNTRIGQMGLYSDVLRTAGRKEEIEQPR